MMIDGLFNNAGYLTAKKLLDATVLRHDAIAANLANLETPNYKRLDLAPAFSTELRQALATGDLTQLTAMQPKLEVDPTAIASHDGNTVSMESELLQLQQNSVAHAVESQLITASLLRLRTAITGRSL